MDIRNNPCFMLLVLFLFLSLDSSFCHGADTISTNQSLSGDQTIISPGGVFVLGFFKPGKSSNFYIGMWYKQVSLQTIVWVANRDRPVSDKYSSELKIWNGNLVLLSESQTLISSTNLTSTTSNSIEAVLHDTGNLVLSDGSNSLEPLWQSFDYPTDTWLPSSKIGLDKRTKTNRHLTSWKNLEDPASGLFSLELDPNGTSQYLIVWNRSEKYWTSGAWDGNIFSLVPEMRLNYIYNFSYVSNKNENYFIYSVENPNFILSRFMMDVSGQIKQLTWLNSTKVWSLFWAEPRQCEVYAFCGTFAICNQNLIPFCNCLMGFEPKSVNGSTLDDYSGGCVRKTPLQCGNNGTAKGETNRFFVNSIQGLPDHPQFVEVSSAVECRSTCLNNCSCTAYAFDSNGCSIWFGDLLNLQKQTEDDSSGKILYIRLAASELPSPSNNANNSGMVIGIFASTAAGIMALFGLVLFVCLRRRSSFGIANRLEGSLVLFGYRELQNATKNFSEKLGGGGFGSVFKGKLHDSTIIAVKKLESINQKGESISSKSQNDWDHPTC